MHLQQLHNGAGSYKENEPALVKPAHGRHGDKSMHMSERGDAMTLKPGM